MEIRSVTLNFGGSGSLFSLGGSSEVTTVSEESTGLFEFNGTANQLSELADLLVLVHSSLSVVVKKLPLLQKNPLDSLQFLETQGFTRTKLVLEQHSSLASRKNPSARVIMMAKVRSLHSVVLLNC